MSDFKLRIDGGLGLVRLTGDFSMSRTLLRIDGGLGLVRLRCSLLDCD